MMNKRIINYNEKKVRKMKKLVKLGYVKKGCLDNHADTFYLTEEGIRVVKECKEVDR